MNNPTKKTCICCRKRRIKCDGDAPSCYNCIRSAYECVWIKSDLVFIKDFIPKKLNYIPVRFVHQKTKTKNSISTKMEKLEECDGNSDLKNNRSFFIYDQNITKKNQKLATNGANLGVDFSNRSFTSSKSHYNNHCEKINPMEIIQINPVLKSNSVSLSKLEQEAAEDARYRHLIIKSNEKLEISSLNGCNTWILGVHLTQKEAMFYDSFVKGFMVSVSPQFSHISLQPSTVFIPHGVKQSLVREAFYSCGAAFLCWNSNGLIGDAKQKGHNCTRMIYNFLEHNEIKNNENWLLVAILCLCLRERYLEQDISTTMFHLTTALKIIRKWQEYKLQRYKVGKLLYKKNFFVDRDDEELLPLDIEQAYVNDIIFDGSTEFETMDTHIPGKLKSTYDYNTSESEEIFSYQISEQCFSNTSIIPKIEVTTNERTLIESFIYNYSINLFLCDDSVIRFVASPFKIFKELKPFLINPVYNCSDPSMNNPIMGAALPAFELVAKANWLALKYPLNERGVAIASQIQTHAKLLSCNTPHTSSFSNLPPYLQRRIKESHHLKEIVSNCVWIFMEKFIHPEMSSTCTNIQNLVESTIVLIEKLSLHSPISVICTWPFAILGTVLIHVYQREYLELRISEFDEAVRMKCLSTITHFLSLVWEKHDQDEKGWDVLLDKHFLRQLFL